MSLDLRDEELQNYRALVHKVDDICTAIDREFTEHIQCHAGCSGCCRDITLFPVEAAALLLSLEKLDPQTAAKLTVPLRTASGDGCPLLDDDLCLVYADRPLICRTHGLPLMVKVDGENRVDFCPENFQETRSLPGKAIINLDLLNHALVAINELFIKDTTAAFLKNGERLSISSLINLWRGSNHDPA